MNAEARRSWVAAGSAVAKGGDDRLVLLLRLGPEFSVGGLLSFMHDASVADSSARKIKSGAANESRCAPSSATEWSAHFEEPRCLLILCDFTRPRAPNSQPRPRQRYNPRKVWRS